MAGLLDAIFPSSDGGGLLDFLKRNAMAQQPLQNGAPGDQAQYGAPPPAMPQSLIPQGQPQQPQAPVSQNPPPVIRANIPPAGPAPAPAAAPQAPSPFMPAMPMPAQPGGFLGNFARVISNIPRGGADDPNLVAQRQQAQTANLTARALVQKGVDPNIAMAAVQPGNGDLLKQVWTQAFGQGTHYQETDKDGNIWDVNRENGQKTLSLGAQKDKFVTVQTGEDAMGRKQFSKLNQSTGELTPIKAAEGEEVGSGLPGDVSKTGDEYIASLPQQYQSIVRGFVEGTAPMPHITTKNQQAMQNYFDMAKQADPSFDAANYQARQKGLNSFKSGPDATTVRSANQVLGHIGDLADKADALNNGRFPLLNWVENGASSAVGNDAANNWVLQAHAVADELSGFMKGAGHNSDSEIRAWNESLTPNMSPQQQRGAIKTLMGIYDHALQALEDKRTTSIGPMAAAKMGPLLTKSGQAALNKVNTWANGGTAPSKQSEPSAAPAVPTLDVGQSHTVNTPGGAVTIKKTSNGAPVAPARNVGNLPAPPISQ